MQEKLCAHSVNCTLNVVDIWWHTLNLIEKHILWIQQSEAKLQIIECCCQRKIQLDGTWPHFSSKCLWATNPTTLQYRSTHLLPLYRTGNQWTSDGQEKTTCLASRKMWKWLGIFRHGGTKKPMLPKSLGIVSESNWELQEKFIEITTRFSGKRYGVVILWSERELSPANNNNWTLSPYHSLQRRFQKPNLKSLYQQSKAKVVKKSSSRYRTNMNGIVPARKNVIHDKFAVKFYRYIMSQNFKALSLLLN